MVVVDIGAKVFAGSITLGNKILIVEFLSNIEFDLQLTPITFMPNLCACLITSLSSDDSPEALNIKITSLKLSNFPPRLAPDLELSFEWGGRCRCSAACGLNAHQPPPHFLVAPRSSVRLCHVHFVCVSNSSPD